MGMVGDKTIGLKFATEDTSADAFIDMNISCIPRDKLFFSIARQYSNFKVNSTSIGGPRSGVRAEWR